MSPLIPSLLAWAALAGSAFATPIPPDAVAKAKDIAKCWKANPFGSALPQDDGRSAQWNNACVDQRDACGLLHDDAEKAKVKDGYCLTCTDKPAPGSCAEGTSCQPETVCKAPPAGAKVTLGPPSEGEGEIRQVPLKTAPPALAACKATPGCISRYVAAAYANGVSVKTQMNMAWSAALGDRDKKDYSKCDSDALRNTEHYLYHYWSRLDSQVYNQMPLTFCGISYGYSAAKWTGVWGAAKKLFTDDDKPDSAPSMEEAYWGCRGLWDAYEPEQKVAFGACN